MMFKEQTKPWFHYLMIGIFVVSVIGSLALYFGLAVHENESMGVKLAYWLAFGVPIMWFIWLSWAFSIYDIQYDGNFLSFGYLGWGVQFKNSEINSAKVVEIKWLKWGGLGWRIRGLKRIGYIVKSGTGVELQTHRKGRVYTFNCNDPKSLLDLLERSGIEVSRDSAV